MPFLSAWTELSLVDLARRLGPVAAVLIATFLPGAGVTRVCALAVAILLLLQREPALPVLLLAGWSLLWLWVAWRAGQSPRRGPLAPGASGRGRFESGVVALPLGLALLALMIVALARQPLAPDAMRNATVGVLLLCTGTLHLMLRRHVARAALAFAALGLGLETLHGAARAAAESAGRLPTSSGVLLATALAVALLLRLGEARERFAGSPMVSEAHELHD